MNCNPQTVMKSIQLTLAFGLAVSCFGEPEQENIATEFVTLSLSKGIPQSYYYRDGDAVVKLDVSALGIGSPAAYNGPALLALFENAADLAPPAPNQPVPQPSLLAQLPAANDRILLAFSEQDTPQGKVRKIHAIGISTTKLKAGDYRIFNFANKRVFAIMDEKKIAIQPGKHADVSKEAWKNDTHDMHVQFGLQEGEGLRQVYSSLWGHRPGRRTFLFIFDRPDEFNPFEIRRYHDVPDR